MNEEKSMVEYKESRGILGWLKSKFEKLKDKFRPTKNIEEPKKQNPEDGELSVEQLDEVMAGIDPNLIDFEEVKAKIDNLETKSWELTEEEQIPVQEGFEEIRARSNQQEEQEMSLKELNKITAGHPIIDEDEYSK